MANIVHDYFSPGGGIRVSRIKNKQIITLESYGLLSTIAGWAWKGLTNTFPITNTFKVKRIRTHNKAMLSTNLGIIPFDMNLFSFGVSPQIMIGFSPIVSFANDDIPDSLKSPILTISDKAFYDSYYNTELGNNQSLHYKNYYNSPIVTNSNIISDIDIEFDSLFTFRGDPYYAKLGLSSYVDGITDTLLINYFKGYVGDFSITPTTPKIYYTYYLDVEIEYV